MILSPAELENILLTHESVENAAVIGIKDEDSDEIPMAFVSLKNGFTVTEDILQEYVDSRVNDFKKLRGGVKILDKLPTTGPQNKMDKNKLRQLLS